MIWMIMPESPKQAVMVSLSTSRPMSKIKERKVILPPAHRAYGPAGTLNLF